MNRIGYMVLDNIQTTVLRVHNIGSVGCNFWERHSGCQSKLASRNQKWLQCNFEEGDSGWKSGFKNPIAALSLLLSRMQQTTVRDQRLVHPVCRVDSVYLLHVDESQGFQKVRLSDIRSSKET